MFPLTSLRTFSDHFFLALIAKATFLILIQMAYVRAFMRTIDAQLIIGLIVSTT